MVENYKTHTKKLVWIISKIYFQKVLPTTQIKQWDSNKMEENKMKTLGSKAYIYFNKFEIEAYINNKLTKSTIWLKTIKPIEKLVWTNIYIYIYQFS